MSLFKLFDFHRLGAACLAAGPLLMQFGKSETIWWGGMIMIVTGPLFMAIKAPHKR